MEGSAVAQMWLWKWKKSDNKKWMWLWLWLGQGFFPNTTKLVKSALSLPSKSSYWNIKVQSWKAACVDGSKFNLCCHKSWKVVCVILVWLKFCCNGFSFTDFKFPLTWCLFFNMAVLYLGVVNFNQTSMMIEFFKIHSLNKLCSHPIYNWWVFPLSSKMLDFTVNCTCVSHLEHCQENRKVYAHGIKWSNRYELTLAKYQATWVGPWLMV